MEFLKWRNVNRKREHMAVSEKRIKEIVRRQLQSLAPDCWFFMPATHGFGRSGIPDFVGVYRGFGFAIETKASTGVLSPHQHREITAACTAGAYAFVVSSTEQAEQVAGAIKARYN
jgi:hypothetical protein